MRRTLLATALAAALATVSPSAEARTVRDEPYALDTTWSAALRLVRVDFGFTIEERDRDLGYFTFQYREGRRTTPGSVEVLRTTIDGRPGTRIIVQVPQMPTYVESMMLSQLSRKLRAEFGEPPPPRPAQPPGERQPDGPAQPDAPAQPERSPRPDSPAAPTTHTQGTPNTTLTRGRWEAPARVRLIDDFGS